MPNSESVLKIYLLKKIGFLVSGKKRRAALLGYRLLILVFLGLIWPTSLWAASWVPHSLNKPSFRFGITGGNLGLNLNGIDKDPADPIVKYRPNSLGRLSFGAQYMGFGATLGFTGKQAPEEEIKKGETDGMDYQFRFFNEQNSFDVFYQKYSGYFIENSNEVDPTWIQSDPFLQRSDIKTEHIGFQYFRTLDPVHFSMAACFDQSGWQRESGGTWFLYSALDQHRISADKSIVPTTVTSAYSEIIDFKRGIFTTAKLGFGGAYSFVYNSFFIATQFILAAGQQQQTYSLGAESTDRLMPASGGNFKLSLGYNGPEYFSSFNLFSESTNIFIKNRAIEFNTTDVSVFVGTHL